MTIPDAPEALLAGIGRVVEDRDGAHLVFERTLPFAVVHVWAAVTTPEHLARWFGVLVGDPSGGTVELLMTAEEGADPEPVTIHECAAPHRLRVTMGSEDGEWRLELILADDGGATRMVLVHHVRSSHDVASIGPGWQLYLDRLHAVLAREPVPDDFDRYYPALAGAYRTPASLSR